MSDTTDTMKYMNRGGEVWERTDAGEREIFAADVVKRLTDLERQLAEAMLQRDDARGELAEWKTLQSWGGTPEIINDFIKGQQTRIHAAQHAEDQRDRLAELLKPFALFHCRDLEDGEFCGCHNCLAHDYLTTLDPKD